MTRRGGACDQAIRIHAAMLETVSDLGYAGTTVEDIVRVAGVSRRTFYEHFPNREACFLNTLEQVMRDRRREALAGTEVEETHDGITALRSALVALLRQARDDPMGTRILFVEAWTASTASRQRAVDFLDEAAGRLQWLLQDGQPTPQVPDSIAPCLAAGLVELVATRCLQDRVGELIESADDLAHWMGAYRSTGAVDVVKRARRQLLDPDQIVAAQPVHALERSAGSCSSGPGADPVQRILDAIPRATAKKGDNDLSVNEIVRWAHVSQHTFREHFGSAEEARAATALAAGQDARSYYLPYVLACEDWESSVLAGLIALSRYFSQRPSLGRFLYFYLASEGGRRLRQVQLDAWRGTMLLPGFRQDPAPRPIVGEAIAGAVYRAVLHGFVRGDVGQVAALGPPLAYIALAPFLGADRAAKVIDSSVIRHAQRVQEMQRTPVGSGVRSGPDSSDCRSAGIESDR